ncbi:MAG: hypothetical protein HZA49_07690 [Planctomycetes bacterium]|nr:hypothetical protein [Planctomycetota bacterium]
MLRILPSLLLLIVICGCSKPAQPVEPITPVAVKTEPKLPSPDSVMAEMKEELGDGYLIDYAAPYVIAGNIPRPELDRIRDGTIKGCSAALYQDYFEKKPDYLIKVYLFKDAETYEDYCVRIGGRKPSSPYGFYQDATRSLIMNIGTGTGTLVHEMVHALIKPDFPDAPAWFNEGLGSLYEQCRIESGGSLRGLINWRYQGLMEGKAENKLRPLKDLLKLTEDEFYGQGKGLNYAQARYFCLYLQEQKVLSKFYKRFRDDFKGDQTGTKFVEQLLNKSIDSIDNDWQKWVITVKDIEELR